RQAANPEPSHSVDAAVVETLLGHGSERGGSEGARRGAPAVKKGAAIFKRGDKASADAQRDAADLFGQLHNLVSARCRVSAMDFPTFDIDPIEALLLCAPTRRFAEQGS